MKRAVSIFLIAPLILLSCKTINVEEVMANQIQQENEMLKNELEEVKKLNEVQTKEEEYVYDVEPVIVPRTTFVVVDRSDVIGNEVEEEEQLVGKDAVKQSLKDSVVDLKEYIGGTSIFDYDENVQFPVFTKKLAMTTIILNDDEAMVDTQPFMSDTESWVITGDVWQSDEGERQLIMLKPKESGLETNMLIVTNKRLYHFILYSTKDDYQPMVKFRYVEEPKFITSRTKKQNPLSVKAHYQTLDPSLVSFNYKISVPTFQKKIDWVPEMVYDDGSHTYILLPEIVLQKEFPALWEESKEITNYEIHPTIHNLIIVNKLIEEVTLKVGKQKVTIQKKKGMPKM